MSRYHITSAGFRGHIHLWDDIRTYSNAQRLSFAFENANALGYQNVQPGWKIGQSVSVDLNYMVVGIPGGSKAVVYEFDTTSSSWKLYGELNAGDFAQAGDEFGYAVSVSDYRIAVGAPGYNNGQGAVYMFERKDGSWRPAIPFQIIADDSATELDARFGESVCYNGQALAVGAPNAFGGSNSTDRWGAVYTYAWGAHNRNLSVLPKITLTVGQNGQRFGHALSFNNDNSLAIGSPNETLNYGVSYTNCGAVYVYQRTTSQANVWAYKTKIIPTEGENDLLWGQSVSFRKNYVLVGAPGMDMIGGAALFFGFNDTYTLKEIFKIRNELDGSVSTNDKQGWSVAMDGEHLAVLISAPYNDGKGAYYAWAQTEAGNWLTAVQWKVTATDGSAGDQFGYSVAQSDGHIGVGAPGHNTAKGGFYKIFTAE